MRNALFFSLCLLAALPAESSSPCQGLRMMDGVVSTGMSLQVSQPLNAKTKSCVAAIGAALKGRPALRTVTVAVRVPASRRADGEGLKVAEAVRAILLASGLPKSRVSVVVPSTRPRELPAIQIAFTERRVKRHVAVVSGLSGKVVGGGALDGLQPVAAGQRLGPQTFVQTDAGSRVRLQLADGSRIRLAPGTLLLVGRIKLSQRLKREVELTVKKGRLDLEVPTGGKDDAYRVLTPTGVAGVRGTDFRVHVADNGDMRLETVEGLVNVKGAKGEVDVPAGQATSVDAGGRPAAPIVLPEAPLLVGPLEGRYKGDVVFSWKPVAGADGYRIRLARDPDFVWQVKMDDVTGTDWAGKAHMFVEETWFWQVIPKKQGFLGKPSKVYAIEWGP